MPGRLLAWIVVAIVAMLLLAAGASVGHFAPGHGWALLFCLAIAIFIATLTILLFSDPGMED